MKKRQKNRWLKIRFKDEVFTNLCKKDVEMWGKPRHHIHSSYAVLDWVVENLDLIPKNVILSQKKMKCDLEMMNYSSII